jgi:hypothetical protein
MSDLADPKDSSVMLSTDPELLRAEIRKRARMLSRQWLEAALKPPLPEEAAAGQVQPEVGEP